jgi:hypothetical protein
MSETAIEFNSGQRQKVWLTRLAGEFEKVEKLLPVHFWPQDVEFPKWVENIEREISLVLLPAAKLRDAKYVITPKRMGSVIGHGCGMAVAMMEWFAGSEQITIAGAAKPLTDEELKQADEFNRSLATWYNAARRLAKLSLCSCVDQTYEDMRDFLTGFADGFSRKPRLSKASEIGNPTFEIYLFMMIYWRLIERMGSVRQLHESLVTVFGASRVGEQKRIEKICQRIGLSFRKPGRPKKE